MKTTDERVKHYNIDTKNIKFLNFPSREEYVNYLQTAHVFVSCARSEGWNLPLIEAMACGTPSIYSDWSGQLEFAEGKGLPVKIKELKPANVEHKDFTGHYCEPDWDDLSKVMLDAVEEHKNNKIMALVEAKQIHEDFIMAKPTIDHNHSTGESFMIKLIFFTCLFFKALTANATAVYVLPVPAGPIPNVIVFSAIASTYAF